MDLMIHYQDEPGLHNHMEAHERMRAIQLPLWSEMNHVLGGIGMNDPVNGTTGSGAANSNVSANHPLLMGRQANGTSMEPAGPRGTSRSLTRQLHRGFRGYLHMGNRGQTGPTAPATLLQNFLGGGNHGNQGQDWLSQGLRRGGPLLVDFGYAILDSLESDVNDLENTMGGGTGRAALSTIPSALLVRWNEESRVIDGDSMHDCVTALKPRILEIIEKARDEELAQRKAKKKQQEEEEEAKRKASEKAASEAAAKAAAEAAATAVGNAPSEEGKWCTV